MKEAVRREPRGRAVSYCISSWRAGSYSPVRPLMVVLPLSLSPRPPGKYGVPVVLNAKILNDGKYGFGTTEGETLTTARLS